MAVLGVVPALHVTPKTSKPCILKILAKVLASFIKAAQLAMPSFFAPIFLANIIVSSTLVSFPKPSYSTSPAAIASLCVSGSS